tara:strand:+ start:1387 stop:3420 length:2034 start_codon:yes stop_codon:yes gene_type:complete
MAVSTILYIILIGIIALITAIFFYFYKPERSRNLRYILSGLRFLSIFTILLLLLNPEIKQVTYTTIKPKLALAVDNSESIEYLRAKSGVKSLVNKLINDKRLNKRFEIDTYKFGGELQVLDSLDFLENTTDVANAISGLSKIYKDDSYIPILITDGNSNLGANYRYSNTSLKKTPLNFVVVGDTTQYEDLSILRTNVNKYAYLKNEFPVEITTSYQGVQQVNAILTVKHKGSVVYTEKHLYSESSNSKKFNFHLKASEIGIQNYTATITGLSNEKNTVNNTINFAVEVIDQRSKILITYSVLHPDLGTLKKSIEQNQLRSADIKNINSVNSTDINAYDLIILFEPDSQFENIYNELNKLNKNRFIIAGKATNRRFFNTIQKVVSLPLNNQTEEVQPLLNKDFSTFQLEDLDLKNYPPIQAQFGTVKISGQSDILVYQRINGVATKNPLLGVTTLAGRKEVYLFGTGIYQWRMQNFIAEANFKEFDKLIDKLVQFAASNDRKDRLLVDFERFYYGGNSIKLSARFFDQNYIFDTNAQLTIKISGSDSTYESPLAFKGTAFEATLSNLTPDTYTFSVIEKRSGLSYSGEFTIIPYNLEHQNMNADYNKLKLVAQESEGIIVTSTYLDDLIDQLLNDDRYTPVQRATERNVSAINYIILLIIIASSLSCEWFIRKYNGLI